MRNIATRKTISLGLTIAIAILAYNNCGEPFRIRAIDEQTQAMPLSPELSCDENLYAQYKDFIYPFFRQTTTCLNCHVEGGPGLGLFASANHEISYAAFSAAGVAKVSYMATNAQHRPPYTGPHHQSAIDTISSTWAKSQEDYLDCVNKTENGGVNESLLTSAKTAPQIYSAENSTQTLSWDLDLASGLDESTTRSLPVRISIDVRVLYQTASGGSSTKLAKGYVFSNPVLQLKDASQQLVIEGLFFYINKQLISSQTTFTSLSRVVYGSQAIPLMNAQANTLIEPLSNGDQFQIYIRRIVPTSGAESAAPPMTPILRVSDSTTLSEELLRSTEARVSIMRDSGSVRWCLSENPTPPESTEAPCVSTATGEGTLDGWYLSRPTSYRLQDGDGEKHLYLWVADKNLKINQEPATVRIRLDTIAPEPPVLGSIQVTDTQVGTMSVSHPHETDVKGWCVIEQNSIESPPNRPALSHNCWKWTDNGAKPTTVGFKEGGSRTVWVFTRDEAGNVSSASNSVTVTNPFGAITFTQLTSSSGGPLAVFYNRCYTCHGSSANPGFNRLQLFNFTQAISVGQSGVLISRINNPISPMPNINGGLMPQRERDLIRLWTMPEEGNTPLP